MADRLSAGARSQNMARIRCANTKPEEQVVRIVRALGFTPKQNAADLPGKPDLVFPHLQKVIFVHGCYWHRHTCRRGQSVPSTNRAFWRKKLAANFRRDARTMRRLRSAGWSVAIVWECRLCNPDAVAQRLKRFLHQ